MSDFGPFDTPRSELLSPFSPTSSNTNDHDFPPNTFENHASTLQASPSARKLSGTTATLTVPNGLLNSSPASSTGDSSPWIGGTGLGSAGLGKSGRVIERLMAENDRLRREIRAEITKREELQRAALTEKPKLEHLQSENARLANVKSMDDNIISRRDRKIAELKAELDLERQKREGLEHRAQESERRREEHEEHSNKEVQQAAEQAKHATVHATILETSHKQLANEYRQRTATMNRTLKELHEREEDSKKKMVKLDVVNHQMRQEVEKMRKVHGDFLGVWDRYREEKESQFRVLVDKMETLKSDATNRDADTENVLKEMHEVMGQMKWLMALKKVATENSPNSPPPSP